jgi:CRISPR-associated exonuclease Cas4
MPEWNDDQIVLISALEHYGYCPRQCALIHVEKVFDENIFTLRGSTAHARVDEPSETTADGIVEERGLPIWSERYGLYGRADVVEFHRDGSICPVEYKHGRKRKREHDELQLCAQAICLEEMFGKPIARGAVYSSSSHARREVELTEDLRRKTLEAAQAIREMCASSLLPPPVDDARCPNCSLVLACMPSGVEALSGLSAEGFLFAPGDGEVAE